MSGVQPESGTDERCLVDRAQQGDRAAFGLIYQHYVDRVYSFVHFRVRDDGLAEDLTQEVFIQALRGLGTYDWRGSLAPWLLRIARNTVIDHWRTVARRPERPLSVVEIGDEEGDETSRIGRLATEEAEVGLAEIEGQLDRAQLIDATARLTDLQQQVIALRFAAGLSIRETAEALGRTEGAVKNLQHHALRAMRRHLAADACDGGAP